MHLLGISGSPSARSRSAWLLAWALDHVSTLAARSETLVLRELPAAALLSAALDDERLRAARDRVARADVVLVSTPIYQASYSGLLKAFLDVLPQDALRGKTVLPLATGGSAAHLLALDYALKPVLSVLGARHILDGVYASDAQLPSDGEGGYLPDETLSRRLQRALEPLVTAHAYRTPWRAAA